MSTSLLKNPLLDLLKVKQPPKLLQQVRVVMPKEAVVIKTKIVDKTAVAFDRGKFLEGIVGVQKLTKKVSPKERAVADMPPAIIEPVASPKPQKRKLKIKLKPKKTPEEASEVAVLGESMPKKKIGRRTQKPIGIIQEGPASMLKIGDATLATRFSKRDEQKAKKEYIRASSYYMNNREIFVNFMSSLFGPYKKELQDEAGKATCDRDEDKPFSPMTHQKIVRDYLSLYTPYRGLLLFHGLGSGKTCSSIAIAEGMKTSKPVIVMTPASLRMNYIEEIKKCGDMIYRKNQFWEFISTPDSSPIIEQLSYMLSLSVEFIKKQGGAWLVNMSKPSNFDTLDSTQKASLDIQLNEMIRHKYQFINYNGMRMSHLRALTNNFSKNPFDNAVIIIDEAHNFVSRIVNKMGKKGKGDSMSMKLYNYLLNAQNSRIVLLTGTPIINYPNEIGILFNILRGKIKTWSFKLTIDREIRVSKAFFENIFKSTVLGGNIMDFIEYKPTSTTLIVTRNPFGFVNKTKAGAYEGVRVGERGEIDDETFVKLITKLLNKNGIKVIPSATQVKEYKALPDTLDDFKSYFIDEKNNVKNMNIFKRRVIGLTSYFRDIEAIMPKYNKSEDFHVIEIPMSNFQFGVYEEARVQERKLEMQNAKKRKKQAASGVFEETVSTYRIFSRAFCNYVFPSPDIKRPMPAESLESALEQAVDEDILDVVSKDDKINNVDGRYEADEVVAAEGSMADGVTAEGSVTAKTYEKRIADAIKLLQANGDKYLTPEALETYSPKFLNMLENITDHDHRGLHLIYSQFRTLEGIGIFKLVLEANGFAQFKVKKKGGEDAASRYVENWQLDIAEEDKGKPMFALYTGTETAEEKEIIRNVFNGTWNYLPVSLAKELETISYNNLYGEIIRVLMITASGAEGISLKNVRFVHVTEPYWHPVRMQQVIGRARRICSHQDLPPELRTVKVFLYLMKFTDSQMKSDESIELRLKDKSKIDNLTPITSDQALYEIATLKENVTEKILQAVKESSFDCALHASAGSKEPIKCFSFGSVNSSKFSYAPSYEEEESDTVAEHNLITVKWKAVEVEIQGVKFALNKATGDVYDLDSYKRGQPVQVGKLKIENQGKGKKVYKFERI
tara:strand:- start:6519 stop:9893 length:3375 start_codon:yes stop_codon:yes gene_type:complete